MTIGHTLIGEGKETVIVLHGWFGDHTSFGPMFPYLDTDQFSYAFIDYRGYGKSKDIKGEYTIAEIAQDALALADSLGWDRFHLLGHSMGGKALQRILADAKDRVKSAVALSSLPASVFPIPAERVELFAGAIENDENRYQIVDFGTGNRLSKKWVDWVVSLSRNGSTEEAYAGYFKSWSEYGFVEDIKGISVPLLTLAGEHDPTFSVGLMEKTLLQWFPNASVETIANAGHYAMQETPVYLISRAEDFYREHF